MTLQRSDTGEAQQPRQHDVGTGQSSDGAGDDPECAEEQAGEQPRR